AAADHYMESLAIAALDQQVRLQLINYVAMAELRLDENRLDEARTYCDNADEICSEIEGDHHDCGMMYLVRGKVEQRAAHQDEDDCLLKDALVYFEQARQHLTNSQARTTLSQLYGHMAEVYEELGQSDEALVHWKQAFAARSA
ncbi:MAG TPA: hypothetical protein VGT44_19185, partial [Ktedonobacteraceae bacterium]|nr:hypothetical protein [Ktedonobacteraceae bacterium]